MMAFKQRCLFYLRNEDKFRNNPTLINIFLRSFFRELMNYLSSIGYLQKIMTSQLFVENRC